MDSLTPLTRARSLSEGKALAFRLQRLKKEEMRMQMVAVRLLESRQEG